MTFFSRSASTAARAVAWAQLAVSVSTIAAFVTIGWPAIKADAVTRAAGRADGGQPIQLTEQQKADFVRQYEALPKVSVPIDADGAKVLVVKFNDYQCPPCRQSFYDYKPIFAKYAASGRVKFVLKHFPLESECNAAIGGSMHPASCEAAAAVVMAQSKGTADKLEEWFFANQPTLTPESVKQAAASVAGIPNFDAQYSRALTLVRTDAGMGALLGAKSTPTFVVNGHVIAGAMPAVLFELAIEHELAKK
jgi:protein-disulfide isomerase